MRAPNQEGVVDTKVANVVNHRGQDAREQQLRSKPSRRGEPTSSDEIIQVLRHVSRVEGIVVRRVGVDGLDPLEVSL
jgi:hypothetical protein